MGNYELATGLQGNIKTAIDYPTFEEVSPIDSMVHECLQFGISFNSDQLSAFDEFVTTVNNQWNSYELDTVTYSQIGNNPCIEIRASFTYTNGNNRCELDYVFSITNKGKYFVEDIDSNFKIHRCYKTVDDLVIETVHVSTININHKLESFI